MSTECECSLGLFYCQCRSNTTGVRRLRRGCHRDTEAQRTNKALCLSGDTHRNSADDQQGVEGKHPDC